VLCDDRHAVTVSAAILEMPQAREAFRVRDFGAVFRILRKYQGVTQMQISSATGLTQARVSKLMGARQGRVVHIDVIERIVDGLHIPGAFVGLADRPWEIDEDSEKPIESGDSMLRREMLRAGGALAAGGILHALDTEPDAMSRVLETSSISEKRLLELEQTASSVGVKAVKVPPSQLISATVNTFRSVRKLVRERQKTPYRTRLVRVGSQLATVVGETLFNENQFDLARTWYVTAYNSAMDIGDRYMADIALAGQAYLEAYSDDPNGVLQLLDSRLSTCHSATPATAWLWSFRAKASAQLGERSDSLRDFERAQAALDRSPRSSIRPGIFSFLPDTMPF